MSAPWTASAKGPTCSSSTPTSAVCIPECPVNAILPEEDVPSEQLAFIKLNAELSRKWPSITKRKAPLPDADEWKDRTGKLDELKR